MMLGRNVPPLKPMRRRVPSVSEIIDLIQLRSGGSNATERKLKRALTVDDLRSAARKSVPRSIFEFVDGGAESELTIKRTAEAYQRIEFLPTTLAGINSVDMSATLFDQNLKMPLVLAPTGFCRLSHFQGERAVAYAAAKAEIPYALPTVSTTSIEDAAAVVGPDTSLWFQIYIMRDRDLTFELIRRAEVAGCSTLIVTVDTTVTGQRRKDFHNGFTVPPKLTLNTVFDISLYPRWWLNLLTTDPLRFVNVQAPSPTVHAKFGDNLFDPTISTGDLAAVRSRWKGPLLVKGIQTVQDAIKVCDLGADGIIISSHGGRQLDRSPVPLEVLPAIAAELGGRAKILIDSGIRTGADIAAAIALGADACMVGRPYLYGLMVGGDAGVSRSIDILASELSRTMQLVGARSLEELRGKARLRAA